MTSIWGPRVWNLLHRLSFYSNRQDVGGAWKAMLRNLNEVIPCALCRRHMHDYMVKNPLDLYVGMESSVIRETIILWLYKFHNHVNKTNGLDEFPFDLMEVQYGQGSHGSVVLEAKQLISEIEGIWAGAQTREWRLSIQYLCGLIGGGPL